MPQVTKTLTEVVAIVSKVVHGDLSKFILILYKYKNTTRT